MPVTFILAALVLAMNALMIVVDTMSISEALSIVLQQPATLFLAAIAFIVWRLLTWAGYERVTRTLSLLALLLFVYIGLPASQAARWSKLPLEFSFLTQGPAWTTLWR